ncbi:Flagellin FlgL [Pseudobutyrivibrio sp. ACV-2]|uniref:flagellin N-terminal helical domain-containing protein n=1 Tax=Pseudobutyrivibrio sp. ACV-2 TaxID=1520801 RepID=UPI000897C93F|nr:flagellin [Pseudobutyrivibrio sp. ACV-2]SEA16761.1 Flagellin FlgL [Pseudobutyrivibrio sp. ACV-2]
MVVQHNMQAANASRMLGITSSAQAKSTEKLSSGFRINRAADDAAGLSISEKMRKQIRGLDQASTNAQDGVSAVQTAEGALTEVHSMLQRMNELAVQASNGTNSETDRSSIQDEISQLTTEIDRVAETTKFNETYLLRGDANGTKVTRAVNAHDAGLDGTLTANGNGTSTFTLKKALEDGDKVTIAGKNYTIGSKETSTDGFQKLATLNTKVASVGDSVSWVDANGKTQTKTLVAKATNATGLYATGSKINIDGKEYAIDTATELTTGKLKANDAQKLVSEALADGKKATLIQIGSAAAGIYKANEEVNVDIVSGLDTNEKSSMGFTATTAGTITVAELGTALKGSALAAGDKVTLSGEEITATTSDPANMDTIKEIVKALKPEQTDPAVAADTIEIGGKAFTISDKTDIGANKLTIDDALALLNDRDEVKITANSAEAKSAMLVASLTSGTTYTAVEKKAISDDEDVLSVKDAYKMMAEELTKASSIGADDKAVVTSNNSGSFEIKQGTVEYVDKLNFNLHVGADADMTNKINVDIASMSAASLGVKGLNVSDDTGMSATYAIDAIADAVAKVSAQRSALGAVQNRLEHTIANVDNVVENSTAAESRIRDTDMADEMVSFSKNNILAQAGQSMLAQANQSTQGVLSILG